MADLSTKISNAANSADLEMSAFLNSGLNDAEKGSYVGGNTAEALDRVKAMKEDKFKYLMGDLTGADNNITSTAFYVTRTQDLITMSNDIDEIAKRQLLTSDLNSGIVKRQQEINEWSNSNKLDTLFFLQVLFICLTMICVLVFLKSSGYISTTLQVFMMVLIAAFAVFVLISRARYTSSVRDSRYWDKKRFSKQLPLTGVSVSCPSAEDVQKSMNALLPSSMTMPNSAATAVNAATAAATAVNAAATAATRGR